VGIYLISVLGSTSSASVLIQSEGCGWQKASDTLKEQRSATKTPERGSGTSLVIVKKGFTKLPHLYMTG